MEQQNWKGQQFLSHADFYQVAYKSAVTSVATAGKAGATILEAQQAPGDWSDAATPDLVVAVMTGAPVHTTMNLGSKRFECIQPPKSFIVLAPGVETTILMDSPHRVQCVSMPYAKLKRLEGDTELLPPDGDFGCLHSDVVKDRTMIRLIDELSKASKRTEPTNAIGVSAIILRLAQRLLELRDGRALPDPKLANEVRRFEVMKDYMIAHIADRIDIDELAYLVGIPASHVNRLFISNTGMTVSKYIRGVRLAMAQSLLGGTSKTIADIAQECGFGSSQYFATALSKGVGKSPGEYRACYTGLESKRP